MQTGITDKTALVTGSTQGIGFATASLLAAEGARVILHGRGGDKLDDAVKRIRDAFPDSDVAGVAADLSIEADVAGLLEDVPSVDILVHGYADFSPKPLMQTSVEDWTRVMKNNVAVTSVLSTHYFTGMKERGWGRIVFIGSDSALNPLPVMVPYSVAKMGQLSLMRGLAEMTPGTAITVNAVMPGFTRTERTETMLRGMAEKRGVPFEKFMHDYYWDPACPWAHDIGHPSSLVKRQLEPDEVANMIVYLCSTLSSATNGATLRCDGGAVGTAI